MRSFALITILLLPQDDELKKLLADLRSDQIDVRDAATRKIRAMGAKALPHLDASTHLARAIKLDASLSPTLVAAYPGLADRLATDVDHEYTTAFLAAADSAGDLRRKLRRADLEPLAVRALRGAATREERVAMCIAIARWRIRTTRKEVRRLLGDADPKVREAALHSLVAVEGTSAAAELASLFNDESVAVRRVAIDLCGSLRPNSIAAEIGSLLDDPDAVVRRSAITALAAIGSTPFLPRFRERLDDASLGVRAAAVTALGRLGNGDDVRRVAALLTDSTPEVRGAAAVGLALTGDPAHLAAIRPLLSDKEGITRHFAVAAIGYLGGKSEAPAVVALLKDPDKNIRSLAARALADLGAVDRAEAIAALLPEKSWLAAEALARLGATDQVTTLAKSLSEAPPYARMQFALALGRLASELDADAVKVLEKAASDADDGARLAASIALVEIGRMKPDAILDELLDGAPSMRHIDQDLLAVALCEALLRAREPKAFAALTTRITVKAAVDSPDSLTALLEAREVATRFADGVALRVRVPAGKELAALEIVKNALSLTASPFGEGDTVEWTTPDTALTKWRKRLR
jgi:HEAT repeat protein